MGGGEDKRGRVLLELGAMRPTGHRRAGRMPFLPGQSNCPVGEEQEKGPFVKQLALHPRLTRWRLPWILARAMSEELRRGPRRRTRA